MKGFIIALLSAGAAWMPLQAAAQSFSAILWGYGVNATGQCVFPAVAPQHHLNGPTMPVLAPKTNTTAADIAVGNETTISSGRSGGEFANVIFPGSAASTADLQINATNENSAMLQTRVAGPIGPETLPHGEVGLFRYVADSRTLAEDINGISQISRHFGAASVSRNTTRGPVVIAIVPEAHAFERNNIGTIAGLHLGGAERGFDIDRAAVLPMINLGAPAPFDLSIHKLQSAVPVPEPPPLAITILSLIAFAFLVRRRT